MLAAFAMVFAICYITFAAHQGDDRAPRELGGGEEAGLDIAAHGMYGYPEQFIPQSEIGRACRARPRRRPAAAPVTAAGHGRGGDGMKMVVAYIRHEAFEPIRADLLEAGFPSITITEVKGSGRQKAITEHYRGSELAVHLRPKLKLECVVETQGRRRPSRR